MRRAISCWCCFSFTLRRRIFVVEILYRSSLHYYELFPAVVSSAMGFVVVSQLSTGTPLFQIPDCLPNAITVPWYIVSGLAGGVAAFLFMMVYSAISKQMRRLAFPFPRPIIGGVLAGLVLLWVPAVGGTGSAVIQELITEAHSWTFLLALLVGKCWQPPLPLVQGKWRFGYSFLIHRCCLRQYAVWINRERKSPDDCKPSVSGMAASLASVANVPVAAAVMLIEMVGMNLGIPAVLGSVIGYAVGRSKTIYVLPAKTKKVLSLVNDFEKGTETMMRIN